MFRVLAFGLIILSALCAQRVDPKRAKAAYDQGVKLAESGQNNGALESLTTAILYDPVNPAAVRAYRALGPYPGLNPSDSGGFGLHNLGGKDRLGHDTGFPYLNQGYPGFLGL